MEQDDKAASGSPASTAASPAAGGASGEGAVPPGPPGPAGVPGAPPTSSGDPGTAVDLEEGRQPPNVLPKVVDSTKSLEATRAQVARALIALLAVVILFSFLTLWMIQPSADDLETLLTIIFAPLIALVSGAIGYYFGKRSEEQEG